jgi:hypothetical protein
VVVLLRFNRGFVLYDPQNPLEAAAKQLNMVLYPARPMVSFLSNPARTSLSGPSFFEKLPHSFARFWQHDVVSCVTPAAHERSWFLTRPVY